MEVSVWIFVVMYLTILFGHYMVKVENCLSFILIIEHA